MPVTRSASGTSALTSVDLPTPDWPIITLIFPSRASCSPASWSAVSGRWVTWAATPSGAYTLSTSSGGARSALVRQSSGVMPAS